MASIPRLLGLLAIAAFMCVAVGRETVAADAAPEPISFKRDIAAMLNQRCQGCHGAEKSKGKYRLDTFDRMMKPGSSDAAPVTVGKPDKSELLRLIESHDEDERMPKKADPLPAPEVAKIRTWIEQGALFDGADRGAALERYLPTSEFPAPPQVYPRPVPIAALAFDAGGETLFAGGYHEITVWNASTGKLLRRIPGLPQRTQSLAMSPDGSVLAFAGGTPGKTGEVRLIDPEAGSTVKILDRSSDVMLAVCFNPDGSRLAAGGSDNAIRIYDVKTGKRLLLIEQHADWITDLAFSPDGKHLASASRDKSCRIFDTTTGEMIEAYLEHENPVTAIGWTDDGKTLLSAERGRAVHVWSAKDGKKITQFDGSTAEATRLLTVPGKIFVAGTDQKVRSFSQEKQQPDQSSQTAGDAIFSMAVNVKHDKLAVGTYGGGVILRDLSTGKEIKAFVAAPGFSETKEKAKAD